MINPQAGGHHPDSSKDGSTRAALKARHLLNDSPVGLAGIRKAGSFAGSLAVLLRETYLKF
jgi:hypothetical protein